MLYQLNNVGFSYDGGFSLKEISLEIYSASITAFVGPNGSGKTSLLNLFAFLETPTSGKLSYQSELLNQNNIATFRKTSAYVQQNPYLLRGNVLSNVELGLKLQHINKIERDSRITEVLQLMNITSLAQRSVNALSGGEAQKVAIARALVLKPHILILDEPFAFLDKGSIADLEALIVKLRDDLGKTIIFTTHNYRQAQLLSESIYNIENGRCNRAEFVNIFHGQVNSQADQFDTGNIIISVNKHIKEKISQAVIDPAQIVISRDKLESSMQNNYQGVIKSIGFDSGTVTVTIDAVEEFKVVISQNAVLGLGLDVGQQVWLGFKSSSVLLC